MSGSWGRKGNIFITPSDYSDTSRVIFVYHTPGENKGIVRSLKVSHTRSNNCVLLTLSTTSSYASSIGALFVKYIDPKNLQHQTDHMNFYLATEDGLDNIIRFFEGINEKFKETIFTPQLLQEIKNIWNYKPSTPQRHLIPEPGSHKNLYANPNRDKSTELIKLIDIEPQPRIRQLFSDQKLEKFKELVVKYGENPDQRSNDEQERTPLYFIIKRNYGKNEKGEYYNLLLLRFIMNQHADHTIYVGNPFDEYEESFRYNAFELLLIQCKNIYKKMDNELYHQMFNEMLAHLQKPIKSLNATIETSYSSTKNEITTRMKVIRKPKNSHAVKSTEDKTKDEIIISKLQRPCLEARKELELRQEELFKIYFQYFKSPHGYDETKRIFIKATNTDNIIVEYLIKEGRIVGFNLYTIEYVYNKIVLHWMYAAYNKEIQGLALSFFLPAKHAGCMSQVNKDPTGLFGSALTVGCFTAFDMPDAWPMKQPENIEPIVEKMVELTTYNVKSKLQREGIKYFDVEPVECEISLEKITPKERYFYEEVLGLVIDDKNKTQMIKNSRSGPVFCLMDYLTFRWYEYALKVKINMDLKKEVEKFLPHYKKVFGDLIIPPVQDRRKNNLVNYGHLFFDKNRQFWPVEEKPRKQIRSKL